MPGKVASLFMLLIVVYRSIWYRNMRKVDCIAIFNLQWGKNLGT